LVIGNWAQSPIPNPQSPLKVLVKKYIKIFNKKIKKLLIFLLLN